MLGFIAPDLICLNDAHNRHWECTYACPVYTTCLFVYIPVLIGDTRVCMLFLLGNRHLFAKVRGYEFKFQEVERYRQGDGI